MDNKKHIDRIFQEKLKDFEVFPDAEVWKNIEEQFVNKKKRRVFPLWLRLGSVAATLLFLISSGIWFYNSKNETPKLPDTNTIITDVDLEERKNKLEEAENPSVEKERTNIDKEEKIVITSPSKGTLTSKNKKTAQIASTNKSDSSEKIQNTDANNSAIIQGKNTEYSDKKTNTLEAIHNTEITTVSGSKAVDILKTQEQKDIKNVLDEQKDQVALEEDKLKKGQWSIGSTVAPVYFNTLSKGSPINSTLAENEKSSITSISYGIKVNYKINKRLSLQSGINALDLAYQTKNVSASITSSNGLSNDTNINTNIEGLEIVTISNNDNAAVQSQELTSTIQNTTLTNFTGDLNQSLSYIEVPMEAKYNILQKKLGVNVIGGLSTYVLYRKEISMQNENGTTQLGEASNVNDVNFSGNVGLDVDYSINKKLFINVSPMFKYQFNTFSKNDGGFQPYYLGIYTGLNFRF